MGFISLVDVVGKIAPHTIVLPSVSATNHFMAGIVANSKECVLDLTSSSPLSYVTHIAAAMASPQPSSYRRHFASR